MARPKKKGNNYWTSIQDIAITAYNQSFDNPVMRERIFARFIQKPINDLIDVCVNVWPIHDYGGLTMQEFKYECLVHLILKLDVYTRGKGRSYSFFTVTLRNFIWQCGYKNKSNTTKKVNIEDLSRISDIPEAEAFTGYYDPTFFSWALENITNESEVFLPTISVIMEQMQVVTPESKRVSPKTMLDRVNEVLAEMGILPISKTTYTQTIKQIKELHDEYRERE